MLPSVGVAVDFTVGAPASAAAAIARQDVEAAGVDVGRPTALDIAVISSFTARTSVRYAAALVRMVGYEHA